MEDNQQPEVRLMVLTFIIQDGKVALGLKARKIGEGKWNGFGGMVEEGEELEPAAIREMQEEASVTISDLKYCGAVDFHRKGVINRVHMYVTNSYSGELVPTKEEIQEIKWFAVDDMPWDEMMTADRHWLPQVLLGNEIFGEVKYSEDWELLGHDLWVKETASAE